MRTRTQLKPLPALPDGPQLTLELELNEPDKTTNEELTEGMVLLLQSYIKESHFRTEPTGRSDAHQLHRSAATIWMVVAYAPPSFRKGLVKGILCGVGHPKGFPMGQSP